MLKSFTEKKNKNKSLMKNVLSIVHFPKDVGGRQFSGLSRVMFNISNEMRQDKTINYVTISTDTLFGGNYKFKNNGLISTNEILMFIKNLLNMRLYLNLIKKFYPEGLSFKQLLQYIIICSFSSLTKWDIIHIHSVDHGFLINVKNSPAKSIYTNHGVIADDNNIEDYLNIQNRERQISKMNLDLVVFVSEGAKIKWLEFYGPLNCVSYVIPNAIDTNIWKLT